VAWRSNLLLRRLIAAYQPVNHPGVRPASALCLIRDVRSRQELMRIAATLQWGAQLVDTRCSPFAQSGTGGLVKEEELKRATTGLSLSGSNLL